MVKSKDDFNKEKIDLFFNGKDEDEKYINEVFCDDYYGDELRNHLLQQFDELDPDDESDQGSLDEILYRLHYEMNSKPEEVTDIKTIRNIIKWTSRIAVIILVPLLAFISYRLYTAGTPDRTSWIEIHAPAWSRVRFNLPDGTSGWLNSNSSIRYYSNFRNERHLNLTGEAFFDVFEDKKRPFIVSTNDILLTVLGTRFNVSSYENENKVEVVLEEGSLLFNDPETGKLYTMMPNDLVAWDKTTKDFSAKPVQSQKYLSWKEGRLVFRDDPLDVICRRLGRWYNVDVEVNVNVESCEDISLFATFTDENIEEVLNLLKHSLHIDYRIENGVLKSDSTYSKKKVVIMPRN